MKKQEGASRATPDRMGKTDETMRIVPLKSIDTGGDNIRKQYPNGSVEELAESIKANGIIEPVIVTPKHNGLGYELVTGFRRMEAARLVGLDQIPCMIRPGVEDHERPGIQLNENAQRVNLTPLEEADGYGKMMSDGMTTDGIAAKAGKTVRHVTERLRIAALPPKVRAKIEDGTFTVGVALEIAKLAGSENQMAAMKELEGWGGPEDPVTIRDAREKIAQRFLLALREAPFNTKDESLVETAGSCVKCPKRTCALPVLFDEARSSDRCTDAKCWSTKIAANFARAKAEAKKTGGTVLDDTESAKAMQHGSSVSAFGPYVDLDQVCPGDAAKRTYRRIMEGGKIQIPTAVTRNARGDVFTVAKRSDVQKQFGKSGVELKPMKSEESAGRNTLQEQQRLEKQKRERNRLEIYAMIEAIEVHVGSDRLNGPTALLQFWRKITTVLIDDCNNDGLRFVVNRRNLTATGEKNSFEAMLHGLVDRFEQGRDMAIEGNVVQVINELNALTIELLIAGHVYAGPACARDWCKTLGIDPEKALKKLAEKQKADQKAARDKAARKSSKVRIVKPKVEKI